VTTGIVYSERYKDHVTGSYHPESPARMSAVMEGLRNSPLWTSVKQIDPILAETKLIQLVHPESHVSKVKDICLSGISLLDGGDTTVCEDSYSIALLAAGGIKAGVDGIFSEDIRNAFCVIRPPGHHAELTQCMGFCLFNNAAIAARYAQHQYGAEKIFILDWDVHHGNGTQHLFENDATVFYLSLHQFPYYPGTGDSSETGRGDGLGTTRNFPLSTGSGDESYLDIFENSIPEIMTSFSPDLIILSTGFDAHFRDPLANMNVSTEAFHRMSEVVVSLADEVCNGRILSILEGGYDPAALAKSSEAHVQALMAAGD